MFTMMMIETGSPNERIEEDERPTNGLSARKGLGDHGQTRGRLPDPTAKVPGEQLLGKQIRMETVLGRPG